MSQKDQKGRAAQRPIGLRYATILVRSAILEGKRIVGTYRNIEVCNVQALWILEVLQHHVAQV